MYSNLFNILQLAYKSILTLKQLSVHAYLNIFYNRHVSCIWQYTAAKIKLLWI